jgi:metal-sulfur cluster biosynthetic enzyme
LRSTQPEAQLICSANAAMATLEDVYKELKQVYDPEIPVNIIDLGLVYDVKLEPSGVCNITMTLTSQACPEARTIPEVMKRRVNSLPGVTGTEIKIVWEPAWGPQKISAEGRALLGIDQQEDE